MGDRALHPHRPTIPNTQGLNTSHMILLFILLFQGFDHSGETKVQHAFDVRVS